MLDVACCWPTMLRPFTWAFIKVITKLQRHTAYIFPPLLFSYNNIRVCIRDTAERITFVKDEKVFHLFISELLLEAN